MQNSSSQVPVVFPHLFSESNTRLLHDTAVAIGLDSACRQTFAKMGMLQINGIDLKIHNEKHTQQLRWLSARLAKPSAITTQQWSYALLNANFGAQLSGDWGFGLEDDHRAILLRRLTPQERSPTQLRASLEGAYLFSHELATCAPQLPKHPEFPPRSPAAFDGLSFEAPATIQEYLRRALTLLDCEPQQIHQSVQTGLWIYRQQPIVMTLTPDQRTLLLGAPLANTQEQAEQQLHINTILLPSANCIIADGPSGRQLCCRWPIVLDEPEAFAQWLSAFGQFCEEFSSQFSS